MPIAADDVYMKTGVGLRNMTMYKRYAKAETNMDILCPNSLTMALEKKFVMAKTA